MATPVICPPYASRGYSLARVERESVGRTARRQCGDGALYQRGDGMWIGSVDLGWTPDGKRRRKVVSHRTQAGALTKLREVRKQVGLYGDVSTSSMSLAAWLTHWLDAIAAPRIRPRTLDTYRHKCALITEATGQVRLDKLNPGHVRTVHQYIVGKGLSSTTALQAHRILTKALTDAEREGLVTRNVATLVDAPRKDTKTRGTLTVEQARRMIDANASDPMVSRWAAALFYGLRQGEALGLTWDCVDFTTDTIDLAWQLQRLTWRHGCTPPCGRTRGAECPLRHLGVPAGFEIRPLAGSLCLTRPKTNAGIRVIPMLGFMRATLKQRATVSGGQPNPHDLVWAHPDGRPIDPAKDSTAWHQALRVAGLPPIPLHAARHTTATLMLEAGVDTAVIAAILGHSDVVVTRGYQHASQAMSRKALEAVDRMLTAG